jgi:endonuclease/exonuclease/phosphatase (EEP) superfamily protein YafD
VIFTPKSLTLAKYPVKDSVSEILVISVHGINFDTTAAFKRHMDRAFLMIKDHEGPILFAGDFHTWSNSRTNYLFRLCKKFGLETVAFKNGHRRTKFNGYILDHAFVRGVKVQNAEVLGESQGSDHKPLLLEMNIL